MACQIKRNSNGIITQVLAPNGKDSILYRDIVNNLSNPQVLTQVKQDPYVSMVLGTEYIKGTDVSEVGLAAWSKAYSTDFINQFGDWKTQTIANTDVNGEPNVDVLFPDLKDSKVKEGVDFVFEQNPELASIGTQEQYAEYLNTIFPDSKVKDIVYHGSISKFTNFIKNAIKRTTSSDGIWFTSSKELAKEYSVSEKIVHIGIEYDVLKKLKKENPNKSYKITSGLDADNYSEIIKTHGEEKVNQGVIVEIENLDIVYPSILNIQNLKTIDGRGFNQLVRDKEVKLAVSENKDGLIIKDTLDTISNNYNLRADTYTVFEPEQIHILGSKQDIEGFKRFVSKPTTPISDEWTNVKNNCPKLI